MSVSLNPSSVLGFNSAFFVVRLDEVGGVLTARRLISRTVDAACQESASRYEQQ